MSASLANTLKSMHKAGLETVAIALVGLEIVNGERAGKPHSTSSLKVATGLPYTSVSRIAYQFCELGYARQEHDKRDRRVRYYRADLKKFDKATGLG